MNRRENRQTFRELYEGLGGDNAGKLMDRARTANRIAKTVQNARARLGAYRVKHNALLALKEKFPAKVTVSLDPQCGSYFVLNQTL